MSGVIAHNKRDGVDYRMGAVLVVGGVVGAMIALLFRFFQSIGRIVVINVLYVVMLGSIGSLMMREALDAVMSRQKGEAQRAAKRQHHPMVAALPYRWRFYNRALHLAPGAPATGSGRRHPDHADGRGRRLLLVPAMLYILGMSGRVVVGTSLFNILFVTMATTMTHALTTKAVDLSSPRCCWARCWARSSARGSQ